MIIDEGKLLHQLYYESGKSSREAPELYRKKSDLKTVEVSEPWLGQNLPYSRVH